MGLDFSNSDAHWSYGGFNHFRKKLASALGLVLDEMEGFGGDRKWPDTVFCQEFMYHCDGSIAPEHCKEIAQNLRDLVEPWDDHDKQMAICLAEGLESCGDDGMEFI